MSFPQSSHAWADMRRPQPWGCCDRCGFRYMHSALRFQFDWRGNAIQNLRILVDHRCEDEPQPQLRPILIGPDPYPVRDPRPGFASQQEANPPVPPIPSPPGPTGLFNDGGVLQVTDISRWPASSVGLLPGDLWTADGGIAYVFPGSIPNPLAPPVFYGQIGALGLLGLGGENLPQIDPVRSLQIWNQDGFLCVSLGL